MYLPTSARIIIMIKDLRLLFVLQKELDIHGGGRNHKNFFTLLTISIEILDCWENLEIWQFFFIAREYILNFTIYMSKFLLKHLFIKLFLWTVLCSSCMFNSKLQNWVMDEESVNERILVDNPKIQYPFPTLLFNTSLTTDMTLFPLHLSF